MRTLYLLVFFPVLLSAQNKKETKKDIQLNRVKSITEYITLGEGKNGKPFKSSYSFFDKKGNMIEKSDFTPDGNLWKKETTKYDSRGNIVEVSNFEEKDLKGREIAGKTKKDSISGNKMHLIINSKSISKFDLENNKLEETEFDENGKQVRKVVYTYNSNGERSGKIHYDADNKLEKKVSYTYDSRKMKIQEQVQEANDKIVELKKYIYEYY